LPIVNEIDQSASVMEGSDSLKKPETESQNNTEPGIASFLDSADSQPSSEISTSSAEPNFEALQTPSSEIIESETRGLETESEYKDAQSLSDQADLMKESLTSIMESSDTPKANVERQTIDKNTDENPIPGEAKGLKAVEEKLSQSRKAIPFDQFSSGNWLSVYHQINTGGLLQSTVVNCAYIKQEGNVLEFILDEQQSTLYDVAHQQRLADLLSDYFERPLTVEIKTGVPPIETPSQIILREQQERQQQAEQAIHADPVVQQLQKNFGAVIVDDSIKPIS
jgi:DNA polymerase-3 subunit gamma/tau